VDQCESVRPCERADYNRKFKIGWGNKDKWAEIMVEHLGDMANEVKVGRCRLTPNVYGYRVRFIWI
jgi:hypothetical protein